jgi:outer membrane protein OmpA-like peptidoglycan-associated protein
MKRIFTLSLLLCVLSVFAQSKLKKADKLFETLAYVDAAKAYEEYLATTDKPGLQAIKNAADSYYYTDDNRNAVRWYERLYGLQGDAMEEKYFLRYTQSLKGATDFAKADQLTKDYLSKKGDQKAISHYMAQKRILDSLAQAKPLYTVKTLDVNTAKSDFGTTLYGEKVIFSSSRDTTKFNQKLYSWNKQPFLDLYIADRSDVDGSLFNVQKFLPNVVEKYHEAAVAFAPDFETVYYTTNIVSKKNKPKLDKSRTNNFQIIKGKLEADGILSNPQKLFFNSENYSVGHPAVSEDGKWLFFASDMPGGFGESDLYVSTIAADGTLGTPQNLGPTVNTIGNEMFPFFRDGVLYFSSDGHYGLGDLDVYQSKFTAPVTLSEPKNIGVPINSNRDDFAYVINEEKTYGYVSSNRGNGKGDDDIYYFTKGKPVCNQIVSGKVIDAKSKETIADATIKAFDQFGDLITESKTDASGSYKVIVPCAKKVKLVANKQNYSTDSKDVETQSQNEAEIPNVNFELSKYEDLVVHEKGQEKIIVNPIYFEYDKWNITSQAAAELDRVVFVMTNFPNVKIKIESHTDSRGKDAYNMKLSDNRAKSTQQYIISKGIDATRIESAVGYGESRLVNKCRNGVKCSEEAHLKNRRSDFIIIEK